MSGALVWVVGADERAYERHLVEIEELRRRVVELQLELEGLRLAMGRFEAEYHARVGALFVELDRLRLAIAEYERRILRLRADPRADPTRIEEEIRVEFRGRHEEVRSAEEEARRHERAYQEEAGIPDLDEPTAEDLRALYRELAKRYHPDLARTDEERCRREDVMRRVNAAFNRRDIAALRTIEQEAAAEDPAFDARPIADKLAWATREVTRLGRVLAYLVDELAAVRQTDTFRLWWRQDAGEGVVEALELDLREEIDNARDRMDELVSIHRGLTRDVVPA
ncbi:MAG: J domain-containing protein [Chloroflexota bacterium]|nr:J domain-containing protein [Chloroflexota bacterium]